MAKESKSGRTVILDSDVLRTQRLAKGWTVEDLSGKAGCRRSVIENAEKGLPVFVRSFSLIAEALKINPTLLLPAKRGKPYRSQNVPDTFKVTVTVDIPYSVLSEQEALKRYVTKILAAIGAPYDGPLPPTSEGSTKIELEIERPALQLLCRMFLSGALESFKIIRIEFPERDITYWNAPTLTIADTSRGVIRAQHLDLTLLTLTLDEFANLVGQPSEVIDDLCAKGQIHANRTQRDWDISVTEAFPFFGPTRPRIESVDRRRRT